jgi:hypothetical protein
VTDAIEVFFPVDVEEREAVRVELLPDPRFQQ